MKAFAIITETQSQAYGPFANNDQMRAKLDEVTAQYQNDSVGCQVVLFEKVSKYKARKLNIEAVEADPIVIQPSDIGTPVPQGDVPQPESPEVLAYRSQLEPMSAEDLRQLANLKGIDGRIQNRDRLIEELIMIFKLEQ
jgi:hypothetical protein